MKKFFKNFWLSSLIGLVISLVLVVSSITPKIDSNNHLKSDTQQIDSLLNLKTLTDTGIAILREKHKNICRSIELKSSNLEIYGTELILAIFYFLITSIVAQLIIDFNKHNDSLFVLKRALKEYKLLIQKHDRIKEPYASFIAKKVSNVKHLGGIAFISFCEQSYVDWLIESLNEASKSYESTLTYKPKWFFIDEPDNGMKALEKQEILDTVNNADHIKTKTRILIYKCSDFVKHFEEMLPAEIDKFLELNSKCNLLYVDKEQVEGYFKRVLMKHRNAIEDDFALIDRAFVLKKDNNLGGSIIFGDIEEYQEFFEFAKRDTKIEYFKPIDKKEEIQALIDLYKTT